MKKLARVLTLCLVSLALLCAAVPAAFAVSAAEEQEGGVYVIGLDAAGGECSTVVVYTSTSGKLAALPESPVMEGYTFNGWYTEMVGGSKVSTSTVFAGNTTIYAHWTVKSGTSAGSTAPVQPAAPSIKQHLGTVLVAGILLTTLVAAIAAGM